MKKKVPLLFLTLFCIVLAGPVNRTFADAAELMKEADRLNDNHFYYQAEQIYRTIVENHPNTDYALAAQRKLVCVLIGAEKLPEQVDPEFNKLTTDFANNQQLAAQIHKIGSNCRDFGKYQEAKYYYNYVVENFPDNPQAILSQKDIVKAAIEAEDYTAEQQELDKLKTVYANHPELAKALCSVADRYIEKDIYDKANELNKYIVINFAETDDGLRAQKNLAKTYIAAADDPNAQAAIAKLQTDFENQPGQSAAIRSIADGYRKAGNYAKAIELYQYLIEAYPNDDDRIHCKKGLAVSKIWSTEDANDSDTIAVVSSLATDFNGHPDSIYSVFRIGEEYQKRAKKLLDNGNTGSAEGYFSKAIEQWQMIAQLPPINDLTDKVHYRIAECYMYIDDYNNATAHYKKVVSDWPNSEYKMLAQKYLAIANIGIGDDPNALSQVDRLIVDFNDSPFLPRIVFHIGEEYFLQASKIKGIDDNQAKDYFQKAISVWQRVITKLPASATYTSRSCYITAVVYSQELHEYQKSIEYYQMVVNNWPEYKYADNAHFFLACCFEKLASLGIISEADAAAQIRQTCERLLANYPDSQMAIVAYKLLKRYEVSK